MREIFVNYPPGTGATQFAVELAGTSYCDGSYRIAREQPTQMIAEFIIQGEGTVRIGDKTLRAGAGDVYLLPPGKSHVYSSDADDPWEKIWFNASGTLVPLLLHAYNPGELVVFRDAGCREYFQRILAIGEDSVCAASQKHAQAAIVFHQLLQHLSTRFYSSERKFARETATVKAYIDSHFTQTISLAQLADMVYLSQSQVVRAFKRDTGKTPYEYCLQLKLDHARTLLCSTGLRVKEISVLLGFCDEHYFSYLFKSKTGQTPIEYRKAQK